MLGDLHFMIIQSEANREITDKLAAGAITKIEENHGSYEIYYVSQSLELGLAIQYAIKGLEFTKARRAFSGYIPLACLVKEQTTNFDLIATEALRGIIDLGMRYTIALGNGLLICDTVEQAQKQSNSNAQNYGAIAASQCFRAIELKSQFSLLRK